LDTAAITSEIAKMIKKAEEYVYIVSPYLKIFDRYKRSIEDNDQRRIDTKIIYGKSNLQPGESDWINSLKNASLYYCENLHAKCYANERTLIITSMNLYDFSQINN
jgi:phosphatidylserine/phosphatidylglycerophosphate/cardiolipin synthase-like enzyme